MRPVLITLLLVSMQGTVLAQQPEKTRQALEQIRQHGGLALELARNDPRLEVSFSQTDGKISAEQLAPLKELKTLVHLNLRGLPVTDAQLAYLKDLTALTELHLEKTNITDKGLEQLRGLVQLEYLNLYGTAVTDAGLIQLEGMKKLKHLYLWQTRVTDAGVARLKKALPNLDVNRGLDVVPPPVPPAVQGKKEPNKDKKTPPAKAAQGKKEPNKDGKKK